jgi:hypothetical protein
MRVHSPANIVDGYCDGFRGVADATRDASQSRSLDIAAIRVITRMSHTFHIVFRANLARDSDLDVGWELKAE